MNDWSSILSNALNVLLGPLVVGIVIWWVGKTETDKRIKNEAIRDLMTFRGDYASPEFRRSLNKVSITFHKDKEIRQQIRDLYENINNPANLELTINRKIVGLIYSLCQKNGFEGVTEYDIDQSFPEQKQTPHPTPSTSPSVSTQDQDDPLLTEAIALSKSLGKMSASLLQRRLSIGYARAARILDQLEDKGIIGAGEGAKPRKVLKRE